MLTQLEFVTIHPFLDGNGRLGQLLMNHSLLSAGSTKATVAVLNGRGRFRGAGITLRSRADMIAHPYSLARVGRLGPAEGCKNNDNNRWKLSCARERGSERVSFVHSPSLGGC